MTLTEFIYNAALIIVAMATMMWVLWRWLKKSDDPADLIVRWALSALFGTVLLVNALLARDPFTRIVVVILAWILGLVFAIIWVPRLCDFVGRAFGSLYTGGDLAPQPQPLYSIAEAKRKRGQYAEALAEVRMQLARFPTDFTGWMLLAEIQAENMLDVTGAVESVETFVGQQGHHPKNIAFALNRVADWRLKFFQDRPGAQKALERIIALVPDTGQAQMAAQRIAHLASKEMLMEQHDRRPVVVPQGPQNIGLMQEPPDLKPPQEEPGALAAEYVRHLEAHPSDNETREKLAVLYAEQYRRLDLAAAQLEHLIAAPNQQAKHVVHWLNLLADYQIRLAHDVQAARAALHRIMDAYPKSAHAENALNRIAYLNLELRAQQKGQTVKLSPGPKKLGLEQEY